MHLMRWFRKNNGKIMAVVVIVILFGFIGSSYLEQLANKAGGMHNTVGRMGENKVTNYDLAVVQRQLEILNSLGAAAILAPPDSSGGRNVNLQAAILGELLFSGNRSSSDAVAGLSRIARINNYPVTEAQIAGICGADMPAQFYWLCLADQAGRAGLVVPESKSGDILGNLLPRIYGGMSYPQVMERLINRYGVPESEILATFGRLLAVLQLTEAVCSGQDVTVAQALHAVRNRYDTIDAELVKFDTADFISDVEEPSEENVQDHFRQYRGFFEGQVTDENLYGFGYKLPDMVVLEYIVIKLDEVRKTVEAPPEAQIERYYQDHRDEFTVEVPSDPNDPNSPAGKRLRGYAEVANFIAERLLRQRTDSMAEEILNQARLLAGGQGDQDGPVEYGLVAAQIESRFGVKIYLGKTGRLGAADIRQDRYMGRMYLEGLGQDRNRIDLTKLVFAVNPIRGGQTAVPDRPEIALNETMGPLKDLYGQIGAVLRVAETYAAAVPEDVNTSFSSHGLKLNGEEDTQESVYSIRETVAGDLKKLSAMPLALDAAQRLVDSAENQGWEKAIKDFNAAQDPGAKTEIKPENRSALRGMLTADLLDMEAAVAGQPGSDRMLYNRQIQAMFTEKLAALIPPGDTISEQVPAALEFKPLACCYAVKAVSRSGLTAGQFAQYKSQEIFRQNYTLSQAMAAVFFQPENILGRSNFVVAKNDSEDNK